MTRVEQAGSVATQATHGLEVVLNGEKFVSAAGTLAALVGEVGLAGARVATAVNGSFVGEAQRSDTKLRPGDVVEIVSPRQGG